MEKDYEQMVQDSKDAVRYQEIQTQLKQYNESIRYNPKYTAFLGFMSGAGISGGVMNITEGPVRFVFGMALIMVGIISGILGFEQYAEHQQSIETVKKLTEESQGLEAVVQKE